MRNTPTLHWTLLLGLIASPVVSSAQRTTDNQEPVASLPLQTFSTVPQGVARKWAQFLQDDSESRTLHNPVISADGAWVAAEEHQDLGVGNVRVWSTENDLTFLLERGQNPRISHDSRWVSALQSSPIKESETGKPKNKRAGQTLVLLDTQEGSSRTFEFVQSYAVTFSSSWLVYLQSPEVKADVDEPLKAGATKSASKSAANERKVGTLHLIHLKSDAVFTVADVVQHATHESSDHVGYVTQDEKTGRNRLHIAALGPGSWGVRGAHAGDKIHGLRWANEVTTLGFLDSTETTGKDGKPRMNSAFYTWHVTGPSVLGKFTRVDIPQ